MTIILTEAQYDERLEADKLKGVAQENFLSNGCEQIRYCHDAYINNGCEQIRYCHDAYINNECDRIINLRHGLELRIWSFEPLQDLMLVNSEDRRGRLNLSFFATGDMHTHLHELTEKIDEAAGNSYLMYCPGAKETEGWQAGQKILRVKVSIEPTKFFQGMSSVQFDSLPQQLRQFATKDEIEPFYLQNAIALRALRSNR